MKTIYREEVNSGYYTIFFMALKSLGQKVTSLNTIFPL